LRDEVKDVNAYHNTEYFYASIWDNADPDYVIDSCGNFESEEAARRWAADILASMSV
jgi:hypothetical protein